MIISHLSSPCDFSNIKQRSVITAVVHVPSVSYNNAFKFWKTPFFSHICKTYKSSSVGLGQFHSILSSCLSLLSVFVSLRKAIKSRCCLKSLICGERQIAVSTEQQSLSTFTAVCGLFRTVHQYSSLLNLVRGTDEEYQVLVTTDCQGNNLFSSLD